MSIVCNQWLYDWQCCSHNTSEQYHNTVLLWFQHPRLNVLFQYKLSSLCSKAKCPSPEIFVLVGSLLVMTGRATVLFGGTLDLGATVWECLREEPIRGLLYGDHCLREEANVLSSVQVAVD